MKKVIIALIIVAAVVGIILYFKSRKNKGADDKNADPAKGENGADAPGAAAAGSGYKNKSMSPEEAAATLKVVGGRTVAIKKANPNFTIKGRKSGAPQGGVAVSI